MRCLNSRAAGALLQKLANRGALGTARVEPRVRRIVEKVRRDGDLALRRYAERLDGLRPGQPLRVTEREIREAWNAAPRSFRAALQEAAASIRRFCEWQRPVEWTRSSRPGIRVGQLVRPLESVGCYVPGGRYPLPSTLLMTVIPAQVAGVGTIRVASPRPAPELLTAAALLGVKELYRIGGAQAVAALAYGTESVPSVDKIVGPGNLYVSTAKKLVASDCAIDFLAGPSEVVIVSQRGDPARIAADLVAQAEHDPDSLAVFITTSRRLARAVATRAKEACRRYPIAAQALRRNGTILIASSHKEAIELANMIAPEHITVSREDVKAIRNAGSVFVGAYSPQAVGDYLSGPNHVLPTGGAARIRGGLSVLDFVKIIAVQEISPSGLQRVAPQVALLAAAEGLRAHADSVWARQGHA
jgi:histidinol dehydrogenase